MSGKISLLDQCAKAMRDVPHDPDCNVARIAEIFPCGCTWRWRIAAGLEAALRYVEEQRYTRKRGNELFYPALARFVKAASKPITVRWENHEITTPSGGTPEAPK